MKEFYRLLKIMKEHKHLHFAMATVIGVKGSAYRHAGAKMLFREDGQQYGTISAACLEEDLFYQAKEVLETKQCKNVSYDLRAEDDLSWGQGAGCNGVINIFVESVQWNSMWAQVETMLDSGRSLVCAKVIQDVRKPKYFLFDKDSREIFYQEIDAGTKGTLYPYIEESINSPIQFSYNKVRELDNDLISEAVEPKDQLYVFGAGPDAEPLVDIAEKMDFLTTVIDPRSSRCYKTYFPRAHKLVVEHPKSYLKQKGLPKNSYVVVMTHNFNRDRNILHYLLEIKPKYLGLLGPRKRSERLVNLKGLPDWIYSPVGLNIGAEGPEEISISIISQLIKVRNSCRTAETREK
jgi:xanthine dehydrogenase accessory factor